MRIYIQGDIGGTPQFYNADTHQKICGILFADITTGGPQTEATLHYSHGGSEVADVVRYPGLKFNLSVQNARTSTAGETVVEANLGIYGKPVHRVRRVLSDLELSHVADPEALMQSYREDALYTVLEPLVKDLAAPTGGPVTIPTSGGSRLSADKCNPSQAPSGRCPECKGTGEVELFNGTVPCSTCAPDLGGTTVQSKVESYNFKDIRPKGGSIGDYLKANQKTIRKILDPELTEITLGFMQQGQEFTADKRFPKLNMGSQRNQNIKECPDCKGTGSVSLFTNVEPCPTCCD